MTSLKESLGIGCTYFLREIVPQNSATVIEAMLQVISSWFLVVITFFPRFKNRSSIFLGKTNYRDKLGRDYLMHLYIKLAFCSALLDAKLSQPRELRRGLELVS